MHKSKDTEVNYVPQTNTIKSGIGKHCHKQLPKATVLSVLLRVLWGITAPFLLNEQRHMVLKQAENHSEMGSKLQHYNVTFNNKSNVVI